MADGIKTWRDVLEPLLDRLQAQPAVLMLGDPNEGPFLSVQQHSNNVYVRIDADRELDFEFDKGIRDHWHLRAQLPQIQADVDNQARKWGISSPNFGSLPSAIQVGFPAGVICAHLKARDGLAAMYPSSLGLTLSYLDDHGVIPHAEATPTMTDLGGHWSRRYGGDDVAYSPLDSHLGTGELLAAEPEMVLPLAACYLPDVYDAMVVREASKSNLRRMRKLAVGLDVPSTEVSRPNRSRKK